MSRMANQLPRHDSSFEPNESRFGLDGFILAISAIAFCTSIYFLFKDDRTKRATPALVAMGQFSQTKNDVRRRTGNGVNWERIDSRDIVYDGDSIFTGASSKATLTLADGSRLVVEEKTLLVIRKDGKLSGLDLHYGSITGRVASRARPIMARVNGEKTELRSSDADFRLTSDNASRLAASKSPIPQATPVTQAITTTEQSSTAVETSPSPLPSATPKPPAVKRVELELLMPQSGETIWATETEPVVFQWRELFAETQPHSTTIEFALDPSFNILIGHSTVVGSEVRLPSNRRPTGTFFWRVKNVGGPDGDSLPTEPRQASIHLNVPPEPQAPFDTQEFTFSPEAGEKSKQVIFAWGDRSLSTEYEVQLARDRNFESLILNRKVKRKSEYSPLLPAGTYFWRVAGLHPGRKNSPWSPVVRFVIEEETKTLGTPSLKQTSIRYQLSEKEIARTPANLQGGGRGFKPPKLESFTWTPVARALGYEIEISTDSSFDTSLKLPIGKVTKYTPPEVRPGTLFFRVRAVGRNEIASLPSQTGRLEIKLPAPHLEPIAPQQSEYSSKPEYDAAKHDFQLKWTPLPFAASYEVEFATSADFSDAQKFKTPSTSKIVSANDPNEYKVRVRGLGSDGSPISEYSAVRLAKYEKAFALPPPLPIVEKLPASVVDVPPQVVALQEPVPTPEPEPTPEILTDPLDPSIGSPSLKEPSPNTQLISIGGAAVFINFKWAAQDGAKSYEVQLSKDSKFRSSIENIETQKVDLLLQQKLPKGRVYWRVRAKSEAGYSKWSEPNLILVQIR